MKPDLSGGKGGSLVKLTINESEVVLMLTESVIRRLEALGTNSSSTDKGRAGYLQRGKSGSGEGRRAFRYRFLGAVKQQCALVLVPDASVPVCAPADGVQKVAAVSWEP